MRKGRKKIEQKIYLSGCGLKLEGGQAGGNQAEQTKRFLASGRFLISYGITPSPPATATGVTNINGNQASVFDRFGDFGYFL